MHVFKVLHKPYLHKKGPGFQKLSTFDFEELRGVCPTAKCGELFLTHSDAMMSQYRYDLL